MSKRPLVQAWLRCLRSLNSLCRDRVRQLPVRGLIIAAVLSNVQHSRADIRRVENFPGELPNWSGVNNHVDGNNYGFSASNNTTFTGSNGGPEIGGTFARSNSRGYYRHSQRRHPDAKRRHSCSGRALLQQRPRRHRPRHRVPQQGHAGGGAFNIWAGHLRDGPGGFTLPRALYDSGRRSAWKPHQWANGVYRWSVDWDQSRSRPPGYSTGSVLIV